MEFITWMDAAVLPSDKHSSNLSLHRQSFSVQTTGVALAHDQISCGGKRPCFSFICFIMFVRTKDPGLHFLPLKAPQLNSPFTCEAQHISSSTDAGLQGYGLLPSFFFFFLPFLAFCFSCDPKKGGEKHPVIWIHSFEELYKILTILPGAKLELDAVRINW